MTEPLERQRRYLALKVADLDKANLTVDEYETLRRILDKVNAVRQLRGKGPLVGVMVESDWRCYEAVWSMVEKEHAENAG